MRTLFFFSLLLSMVLGNLAWWWHAHRRAALLKRRRLVRVLVGLWAGSMFLLIAGIITSRVTRRDVLFFVPRGVLAVAYIWHFLFVLGWLVWRGVRNFVVAARRLVVAKPVPTEEPTLLASRRQFLAGAALMAPPAMATLAAWHGVSHLDEFRINRQTLRIPNLPPPLQGITIAQVSDIHIGRFTDQPFLNRIVEQTNLLRPDLVLMSGDLIDYSLADLPGGLEMVQRFQPRYGLAMCEGNHDLMEGRAAFEQAVRWSGVSMPVNGSTQLKVRGYDVQILSLRWGGPDERSVGDDGIEASMNALMPLVNPWAFPILLAHHPHAFDYLGDATIPLILAGHTHGGQINLAPWLKPARLRFRYLSGLYERDGRKLFVSNGVGNWFPLRINAPAEIVHFTLISA